MTNQLSRGERSLPIKQHFLQEKTNIQELTMKTACAISLSLLLLLAVGIEGMVTSSRNKCLCRSTYSKRAIHLRNVIDFEVFHPSQSCNKLEYIVTLSSGNYIRKLCLEPSPEVQKKYEKYQALKKTQHRRH